MLHNPTAEIIPLYGEDVIAHPSSNIPQYIGIDYDRLAEAITRQTQAQQETARAVRRQARAVRRHTRGINGEVDPIKDKAHIKQLAQIFHDRDQLRNEAIVVIGCCVGLRASDLLKLRVGSFQAPNYETCVKEQKTGKLRTFRLNETAIEAYRRLVESMQYTTEETFLFQSQRSGNRHISVSSLGELLRDAQKELQLPYRLGTHSLRKTFAYHIFMDNQTPEILAYLQRLLNHRNSCDTLRYIGLDSEREAQLYEEFDIGFHMDDLDEQMEVTLCLAE